MYDAKRSLFISLGLSIGLIVLTLVLFRAMSGPPSALARPLADTIVPGGPIITHTTWYYTGSPYVLTDYVVVTTGVTLTIEPGVEVQGDNSRYLRVQGHLQALGTLTRPITFTSSYASAPGGWGGVLFDRGTGHLRYVTVRYGGDSDGVARSNITVQNVQTGEVRIENSWVLSETNVLVDFGLYVENSRVVISNTEFAHNGNSNDYGLYVDGGSLVTVTGSTFEDNGGWAVGVPAGGVQRVTGNSFGGNAYDRVLIAGGAVVTGATLAPQSGLEGYELGGNLTVPGGVTLTVEPGATVMGQSGTYLEVLGHLRAVGMETQPITFTSSEDDGPGEWAGLVFSGGTGRLDHTIVRYGGDWDGVARSNITVQDVQTGGVRIENSWVLNESNTDTDYGMYVENSHVAISGTTFADNGNSNDYGLYITGGSVVTVTGSTFENNGGTGVAVNNGQVTMTCATVANNQNDGIHIANAGTLLIFSSAIADNTSYGLDNGTSVMATARYNWWGDPSGPGGVGTGIGDEVSNYVDFDPWLKKVMCATINDADLAVAGYISPDLVIVENPLTYTFIITNYGPSDATSVTQTYTLPTGLILDKVTPSQGVCTGTSTISCTLDALDMNETTTVTIVVTPTAAGTITPVAHVVGNEHDPDLSDNVATVETMVRELANLAVIKSGSSDQVTAGTLLTYTVTVTNGGPADATDVTLTDTLPLSVTYVLATFSQGTGCGESDGVVTCALGTLGTLVSADTAAVTLTVAVDPLARGAITNRIKGASQEVDLDVDDNTGTEETTVNAQADLAVTKADYRDRVATGDPLTYTVAVANNGPSAATGVTLTDTLPLDVTFGSATSSQGTGCTESDGTVVCTLGTLGKASAATVTIVVTPTGEGMITNRVTVRGIEPDPKVENDTDTEITGISAGGYWIYLPLVLRN